MDEFFSSGMVAILLLALLASEGIVLALIFQRTGSGIAPRHQIGSLAAGAGLTLALLAALVGAHWPWIALALVVSLAGHTCDLYVRWMVPAKK
jgi:hypothetical protein